MLLVVASQVLDQMVLQPDLIEGFMIIALSALDRVDTNLLLKLISCSLVKLIVGGIY